MLFNIPITLLKINYVLTRNIFLGFIVAMSFSTASAQGNFQTQGKLKVFIDCSNTYCDMSFIRTEINIVDFMLDRTDADVHVLITEQNTGSGGSKFQLIFFGQNFFKNKSDSLQFNTSPNFTRFENRDLLIKYLKLGLTFYLVKTESVKDISIDFKKNQSASNKEDSLKKIVKDPWNYWVVSIGANGNFNADAVYKDRRYGGNFSVNRTTEARKVGLNFNASKN